MTAPSIEGYAPEWLEYESLLGDRPTLKGSAQNIIDQFHAMSASVADKLPPPDTSVDARDDMADGVPVRIYNPPGASGKVLPIGVFYHGGGYLLENLDTEDALCRFIAKNTSCIIVSADYRKSPTYKMPVMLEDSLTAFIWASKNALTLGGSPSRMFTIGASAGGALALLVADQLIKSSYSPAMSGIVALVPCTAHPSSVPTAYKSIYTSYTENAVGSPVIDAETMKTYYDTAAVDPFSEKCFVTLSKDLGHFPKTYVSYCGKDPLRDDGKVLVEMLKKEGVKTKTDVYEGMPHCFWMFPGIKGGVEFLENVVGGAKWVMSED